MNEEKRYTLREAAAELRRRECLDHGHDWQLMSTFDGALHRVNCSRCPVAYRVEPIDRPFATTEEPPC